MSNLIRNSKKGQKTIKKEVVKKLPNKAHALPDKDKSVLAETLAKVVTDIGDLPKVDVEVIVYQTAEDLV